MGVESVWVVSGIICIIISAIAFTIIDISMDEKYQGNYYLAEVSGSPETVAMFLEKYLDSVKDLHGYSGMLYKNSWTDLDCQKQVVKSFLDRANNLAEQKRLNSQNIDIQLSFNKLTEDMNSKQLKLIRWYIVNHYGGIFWFISMFVLIWLCGLFILPIILD